MKLGIIADSHDNLNAIEKAVNIFNKKDVDWVIHAGDFIAPFTERKFKELNAKFVGIFGNNDGERFGLRKKFKHLGKIHEDPHILQINEKRIIITHHPEIVDALIKSKEYDVVIYGHTHEVSIEKNDNVLAINPGECGGWVTGKESIAILDLGRMEAEIIEL